MASRIAVTEVRKCASAIVASFDVPVALGVVLGRAHRRILSDMHRHPERAEMGTTLTACIFDDGALHVAHAGDSALYLVAGGRVERVTENQGSHHRLSNCLGCRDVAFSRAQVLSRQLAPGDTVVLATDGLTDYLAEATCDADFLARVAATAPFDDLADALVRFALARGGEDNVTVVALRVLA